MRYGQLTFAEKHPCFLLHGNVFDLIPQDGRTAPISIDYLGKSAICGRKSVGTAIQSFNGSFSHALGIPIRRQLWKLYVDRLRGLLKVLKRKIEACA